MCLQFSVVVKSDTFASNFYVQLVTKSSHPETQCQMEGFPFPYKFHRIHFEVYDKWNMGIYGVNCSVLIMEFMNIYSPMLK